jgi:hypothetical protein
MGLLVENMAVLGSSIPKEPLYHTHIYVFMPSALSGEGGDAPDLAGEEEATPRA